MKGRGSVKVEDGKLVRIDVEYEDRIENVSMTGDFFLEPPEAREELEEVLKGLEPDVSEEEVVGRLENTEAQMIGFEAKHIAEALQEALGRNWRIINEEPRSEAMHHALDEVLTEKLENGEIPPTIRFWYRKNDAVPIGRFQSYQDEVEEEYIREEGIEVVRRTTGGGAMFVEPGNVITYSVYIPKDRVPEEIEESYSELDRWVVEALNEIGLEVEHRPLNDIEHEDGKIGGSAQLRKQNAVLHHATLSYDLDTKRMLKALRIGKEKVSDKAIKSAEKRVAVMKDHIEYERDEVIEAMIKSFKKEYGGEKGSLTEEEISKADELVGKKFSEKEWNRKL